MTDTLPSAGTVPEDARPAPLAVDFLYWEECPSHERALATLKAVLREEQIEAQLHLKAVETEEEAEALGFPGSPTIRVNGLDIDGGANPPIGLACRAYRRDDGRITPLPPKRLMVQALHQASRVPTGSHPEPHRRSTSGCVGEAAS